jgi:polysaccharide export outer membrane protein
MTAISLAVLLSAGWTQVKPEAPGAVEETEILQVKGKDRDNLPTFQQRHRRYALRPGDLLQLTFPFTPEFNQAIAVQPDGFITLVQVGELHVAEMSLPDLRAALRRAYKDVLRDPEINVELKDFEKPYFIASGEVKAPGRYDLRGDTTVAQAVAVAGGFTGEAKHSQVLLFRRVDEQSVEVKKINLKKMLAEGKLSEDLHLQPGDLVYVPQSAIGKLRGILIPRMAVGPTLRPKL